VRDRKGEREKKKGEGEREGEGKRKRERETEVVNSVTRMSERYIVSNTIPNVKS
jgi:hypothetical protein